MRVADLMHSKVFTVEEDALIERVFFLMHYEKIRHVPVVNRKSEVIGIRPRPVQGAGAENQFQRY